MSSTSSQEISEENVDYTIITLLLYLKIKIDEELKNLKNDPDTLCISNIENNG